MVKFALAVPRRAIDAVVDQPKIVELRINVNTSHHANSFDDAVSIATVLPPNQLNGKGMVLIEYRVIKNHIPVHCLANLLGNVFTYQSRGDSFPLQVPIDLVMRKLLTVVSKVREGVVDLANQQILTVIESRHRVFHML